MNEYAQEYQDSVGLPEMEIEGIITTNQHFWASGRKIIKSFNNCKSINPWTYNTDFFKGATGKTGGTISIKNCFGVIGDDGLSVWDNKWKGELYNRNCIIGSMRTSPFFTYYTTASSLYYTVNKDIDVYSYAAPGSVGFPSLKSFSRNAIFAFYNAQASAPSSVINYPIGFANGVFEDIHTEGGNGHPVYHPLFRVGNMVRPDTGDEWPPCGLTNDCSFTNVNVTPSSFLPSSLSMSSAIIGLSATKLPDQTAKQLFNRPQDLTITNLKINQSPETFLLPTNVDSYMAWYEPLSGTNSITDPKSVDGSSAGIVFKTT